MKSSVMTFVWIGIGVSLLLATFISPFASSSPDGLERVAEDKGFLETAEAPGVTLWEHAPVPDYAMPGVGNESVATGVAGFVGALGTFFVAFGVARLLRRRNHVRTA